MIIITFIKHWELIKHLTLREIKARYKQSFLGFFWIVLNPFFQMLIMSFVFSHIMRIQNIGIPYPVFLYAGLLPWTFFALSLGSSMSALTENSALIKKIYFPREILIISTILAKGFDMLLSIGVFLALMIFFQMPFKLTMLMFFPILLIQFIFTLGLSLFLSAANLLYRDVQYLFNLVLTLWFYLTPVIYATEFFPERYRWIFKFNPMSVFINAYREVLLGSGQINWTGLGIGVLVSFAVFGIAYLFFKKMEGIFADIV
ncbi:ABC transporter permease [Candidatus Roizmanbacteria bacterium]|nr:ABC transporter permease [Candidatus Roizmanbacteria bacterium]